MSDMSSPASLSTPVASPLPQVVELRRYRLKPGTREALIEIFDREFIEAQEIVGMGVIAEFRDIDDPDAFVWLRGFADMESRRSGLAAFYDGLVWAEHSGIANATMVNSDNVLLLRPAAEATITTLAGFRRAGGGESPSGSGFYTISTAALAPNQEEKFAAFFEAEVRGELEAAGARVVATFVTEHGANTFPRLPVRAGEATFVWLAAFDDIGAGATHVGRLAASANWTGAVLPRLESHLWRPLETARLAPTDRSRRLA
jgi:hypothetical protein